MQNPTGPLNTNKLLTPEQAASKLLIEPKTLAQWRSSYPEKLTFVRVGRLIRYRQSDIDGFIQKNLCGGDE